MLNMFYSEIFCVPFQSVTPNVTSG